MFVLKRSLAGWGYNSYELEFHARELSRRASGVTDRGQGCKPGWRSRSRSPKDSEVFGWNPIHNNVGSWSRIFCPTPDVQLDLF